MLKLYLEQREQAICGVNVGQRHRLLRNKDVYILNIAELVCCQIIMLSIYVPSTHA
jgi:hypothetical protein